MAEDSLRKRCLEILNHYCDSPIPAFDALLACLAGNDKWEFDLHGERSLLKDLSFSDLISILKEDDR